MMYMIEYLLLLPLSAFCAGLIANVTVALVPTRSFANTWFFESTAYICGILTLARVIF